MTRITTTVTSNRKRRRKFNSAQKIERYLKKALVMGTKFEVLAGARERTNNFLKAGYRRSRVRVQAQSEKGILVLKLSVPGFQKASDAEFRKGFENLAGPNARLREVPDGFIFLLGQHTAKFQEAEALRESSWKGKISQLQKDFRKLTHGILKGDRRYQKKVREIVARVTKDLSLADL